MRNLILVGLVGAFVGAAVGFFIGLQIDNGKQVENNGEQPGSIGKRLPPIPQVRSVFGTVKGVRGNVIDLEVARGLSSEVSAAWGISVGGDTEILRQEWKDKEGFEKELEIYKKKLSALKPGSPGVTSTLMEPTPYNVNKIGLKDLKIGDIVNAEADRVVRAAETGFKARRIIVFASGSQPGPSTAPSFR